MQLMRQLVALEPTNARYLNDLGALHAAKRQPAEAEACYRKSIALEPTFPAPHLNLGNALRDQNRWTEAVEAYRRSVELQPQSPEAHHALATALRVVGKTDEAIECYHTALRLRPNSPELHNDLGNTLAGQGKVEEAIRLFHRAIELAPTNTKPYRNLGSLLLNLARHDQAARVLSQAASMEPDNARTQYELGTALARLGQASAAVDHLRRAVALDPSLGQAWCNLGLALEDLGSGAEAAEAMSHARRLLPQSSLVAYHAGALGAGEPPPACPPDYLVELFDNYADRFDDHLFARLNYRGPQLMLEAVQAVGHPPKMDIIDLGCGTGAAGPLFRPLARTLVGVDLAPRMLQKSRERGAYDELIQAEIATALRGRPGSLDLALAGDVFIYIGDLRDVFDALRCALRPGGLFAFTIETTDSGNYVLRPSRRYAQSLEYVRRLAREHGFQELRTTRVVIRSGEGPPVQGAVVVLRQR